MKKGFTLIELLAVIVILAIIALIATPIVLNIINDTKESSIISGAEFYIDSVENAIVLKLLEDSTFKLEDTSYSVMSNGNICSFYGEWVDCEEGEILEIKVKGETPNTGEIEFEDGKIVDLNLIYGTNRVTIEENKLVLKILKSTLKNGILYGDVNDDGLVTYVDAKLIFEYFINNHVEINKDASDIDGKGDIDTFDAALIMQYLAGWDVSLGPS